RTTLMVRLAPRFSVQDAVRLAAEIYGLDTVASPLSGERDQNFRLRDSAGAEFVLKIANPQETIEVLHFQNDVIQRLGASGAGLEWPRVLPAFSGNLIAQAASEDGAAYFVRLLTWVEGVCFADVRPHTPALLASLGCALARMDLALAGFDHPAAHRTMNWDLRHAAMARTHVELLSEKQRGLLEPHFAAWEKIDWDTLPASIIQADANDYNVLADATGSRVVSILDFGDVVYSATVCDVAVALAYVMLEKQDP